MNAYYPFRWFLVSTAWWLCCGLAQAQDAGAWRAAAPLLSRMLNEAAKRIEDREGKDVDRARHALAIALAKSGDFAAARKLATRLDRTGYAPDLWTTIGRVQGAIGGDRAASTSAFIRAEEAVRRMQTDSPRQRDAYVELADARARSGDLDGALGFANGLAEPARTKAMLRLARHAARRGEDGPALTLLKAATDAADKSQAQAFYALALAHRHGDTSATRKALSQVGKPFDKVLVLLALFDHPSGGDDRLLQEALAAVRQNQPEPGAFSFTDVANDAALGAIALRQLKAGTDPSISARRANATLKDISSFDNARPSIERICETLARTDPAAAMSIAEPLDGVARVGALAAIARGLAKRLPPPGDSQFHDAIKAVEGIINKALEIANDLDEDARRWAGVPLAHALALANEFPAAHQVANRLDVANPRAHAHAGIARAAFESRREAQARDALKNLEAAALTEQPPEVAAQIIAQAALAIAEPLLGDEPVEIATAMAGLD